MDSSSLKKALLTNKLIIVKRTLRSAGKPIATIDLSDLDEEASLAMIESKLKKPRHSILESTDALDHWLKRLFKS